MTLTTTRPLSNADRLTVWRKQITSPPDIPERVSAWSVIRDAFGFCLVMAVCGAFVGLLGMQAGVW